jgi:hypothetical protein
MRAPEPRSYTTKLIWRRLATKTADATVPPAADAGDGAKIAFKPLPDANDR